MSQNVSDRILPPYLTAAEELRRNPEQWKAYESKGHCIVLAGPGSGKTKVLTVKLARLITEDIVSPRGIACLTYNNECAKELVQRLARLGIRSSRSVFIGTVHSFCLKSIILPFAHLSGLGLPEPLRVAAPSDQERLFAQALATFSANERPEEWRGRCDKYRRTYLDRDAPDWREQDLQSCELIEKYESLLRTEGLIDFDDMVLLGLRMIESQAWVRKTLAARFPVLVVDEYQDLGLALHRLVLSLCFGTGKNCRLFAVGDPDQSIYAFTGAQPELLKGLAGDERVEVVRLRLNYRSRSSIVSASEIALGEPRGYVSATGDGGIIEFHECRDGFQQQATFACEELIPRMLKTNAAKNLGEIAILYKDKTQGDVVADCAAAAGRNYIRTDANAPYRCTPLTMLLESCAAWCSGGWSKGEPALSDILGRWRALNRSVATDSELLALNRKLVRFLFSHRDCDMSLGVWLNSIYLACLQLAFSREPTLSDEEIRFTNLMALCEDGKKLAAWSVPQFGGQGGTPDHLNLKTLHSAKGLEFDVVFMLGMDQGVIPSYNEKTPASKREPRRLFYVGLTRARYEVHMLYTGWRDTRYGRKYDGPSEFLLEVKNAMESVP